MADTSSRLNVTEFAAYAKVSAGTVSGWLDERMPCKRTGKSGSEVTIDLRNAVRWLAARRSERKGADFSRIEKARAKKLEMANSLAEGEVILADEVKHCVLAAIALLGQAFDALPQRVTGDEALQIKIEDEIRAARDRFAEGLESLAR